MISELYSRLQQLRINVRLIDGNLDLHAPAGVLDNALLQEIKTHKSALIDFINAYRDAGGNNIPIRPVNEQASYPLSPAQYRLWALSQLEEGNITFNMPDCYEFTGDIDYVALENSFRMLTDRHESL